MRSFVVLRLTFFYFFVGLFSFPVSGGQFILLLLCARLEAQFYVDREVVRTNVIETPDLDEAEMNRVKKVVKREPHERIFGMKGVVKSAADSRVEQPAYFLKQVISTRP